MLFVGPNVACWADPVKETPPIEVLSAILNVPAVAFVSVNCVPNVQTLLLSVAQKFTPPMVPEIINVASAD